MVGLTCSFFLMVVSCELSTSLVGCVRDFYVSGIYPAASVYKTSEEAISLFNLAVEMVNNKTDGWWDAETKDVNLVMRLNASSSEQDPTKGVNQYIDEVMQELMQWSDNELVGMITIDTPTSIPAGEYSNIYILPLISYGATASYLERFAYFCRLVPSDQDAAVSMANFLGEVLSLMDATIVYSVDNSWAVGLKNDFNNAFINIPNHRVLHEFPFHGNEEIPGNEEILTIIKGIEATGAPCIFLVVESKAAEEFYKQALNMVNYENYMWFRPEVFFTDGVLRGAGTTSFPRPTTQYYSEFIDLWKSLDPESYVDLDGDRNSLAGGFSYNVVDSVFILAIGIQKAIDASNGVNSIVVDSSFRKKVYDSMVEVNMEMISGQVSFQENGNFNNTIIQFDNFNGSAWIGVGTVNRDSTYVPYSGVEYLWPDNTAGYSNPSYASQYKPYCPPGFYPDQRTTSNEYACIQCSAGFYKPQYGSELCNPCPNGAVCVTPGTSTPCVEPGYWRDVPPPGQDGNFVTYPIYKCFHEYFCLGGCELNQTCASNIEEGSPLCAYCEDGYFLDISHCQYCSIRRENSAILFWVFATSMYLFFSGVSVYVLWKIVKAPKKKRVELFFERNVSVSIKMSIAFVQILSSSVRSVSWSPNQLFTGLLSLINADPMNSVIFLSGALKCAGYHRSYNGAVLFVLLFPLVLLISLGIMSWFLLRIYVPPNAVDEKSKIQRRRYKRHFYFIASCISFVCYIPCSAASFSVFNCDSLGETGSFLYLDYSVECSGGGYTTLMVVGSFGLLIYTIGIPILFSYLLYNRDMEDFSRASSLITKGFKPRYILWEVSDFGRKFLLTSVAQVIAPGRSSQCIYLLFVDLVYLFLLTSCKPYIALTDNFTARIFYITECIIFAVALIDSSGIAINDSYDMNALYTFVFVFLIIVLLIIIPCCILHKIPVAREWFHRNFGFIPSLLFSDSSHEDDLSRPGTKNVLHNSNSESQNMSARNAGEIGVELSS